MYFVREGSVPCRRCGSEAEGLLVKIGLCRKATELPDRLVNLQVGNPRSLHLEAVILGADWTREVDLHASYRRDGYWISGEWFRLPHDAIAMLAIAPPPGELVAACRRRMHRYERELERDRARESLPTKYRQLIVADRMIEAVDIFFRGRECVCRKRLVSATETAHAIRLFYKLRPANLGAIETAVIRAVQLYGDGDDAIEFADAHECEATRP